MGYGNDKKLSNYLPVVKQNPLIEAKFRTTALEYKVLMVAASKIKSTDTILKDIIFTIEDFCNLLNVEIKGGGMYEYLKRVCERLVTKPVSVKNTVMKTYVPDLEIGDKGYTVFPWLHHIRYDEATVTIRFHEYMKPLLLFVIDNEGYTKYLLENITKCNSIYSMRVYELLKQYQKLGQRNIELSELKEMLGIDKTEYKLYSDFKRRVLEHSCEEINEKTDIITKFEENKKGKKVVSIKFFIKSKGENIKNTDKFKSLDALPKEQIETLLQLEIKNRYLVAIEIELIKKYSQIAILKLIKDLKTGNFDKTNIRSPIAFFKWQLEENQESNKLIEEQVSLFDNTD